MVSWLGHAPVNADSCVTEADRQKGLGNKAGHQAHSLLLPTQQHHRCNYKRKKSFRLGKSQLNTMYLERGHLKPRRVGPNATIYFISRRMFKLQGWNEELPSQELGKGQKGKEAGKNDKLCSILINLQFCLEPLRQKPSVCL